jgi:hypothetical protein
MLTPLGFRHHAPFVLDTEAATLRLGLNFWIGSATIF